MINIVWFRRDLRLFDNAALLAATMRSEDQVLPLFIWNPDEDGEWSPGAASRWWLHQSLKKLDEALQQTGSRLIIRTGDSLSILQEVIEQTGAASVFWNGLYEPDAYARDEKIKASLENKGIEVIRFNSSLLWEPAQVANGSGKPFKVFTPFWNYCSNRLEPADPVPKPKYISTPDTGLRSLALETLRLEPQIDWAAGMRNFWKPGEDGAQARLRNFLEATIDDYDSGRDRPDQEGVSMLSPHLHFGEIGPHQIWHAVNALRGSGLVGKSASTYLRELGWRDFAHHVLYHFPDTANRPLRAQFAGFPWRDDARLRERWQNGTTGYPIVDAGMRQLWHTGWMHNRVRMIVASFLTKDLMISWLDGAKWFWDTLVDADLANNTLGWQWAAGCGADAAPYFRIFNPELQGERFDPQGEYVKHWLPELAKLPAKWIHRPWKAPSDVLRSADVQLGQNYPEPIVDHAVARQRALAAFSDIKMDGSHAQLRSTPMIVEA